MSVKRSLYFGETKYTNQKFLVGTVVRVCDGRERETKCPNTPFATNWRTSKKDTRTHTHTHTHTHAHATTAHFHISSFLMLLPVLCSCLTCSEECSALSAKYRTSRSASSFAMRRNTGSTSRSTRSCDRKPTSFSRPWPAEKRTLATYAKGEGERVWTNGARANQAISYCRR